MKQYPVLVSDEAKQSLKEIISYINKDSHTAAKYVRKNILELIESLGSSPEKFAREPLLEERKKELPFGNFMALQGCLPFYRQRSSCT